MALRRFADHRGDRPGRDRGAARCCRSQRGLAGSAHPAADRARLAGREPAQRRNRVVDLPRRRRLRRGVIQPRRRRADPVARGCWEPGRRLRNGATVHGRCPIRARSGQQHYYAIHQHLWGVASVGAPDAVADHHSRGLRHDAGASCLRTVGPTPTHHLLCGMGDRGVRR